MIPTALHEASGSPDQLAALVRYWQWESTIQEALPHVLSSERLATVFQPIFDIHREVPLLRAYEAFTRFPDFPQIPTGMWFSVASRLGMGPDLVLAAAGRAMGRAELLPTGALVFVKASIEAVPLLLNRVPASLVGSLVLELRGEGLADASHGWLLAELARRRVGIAVETLSVSRDGDGPFRPDYLKVDITGLKAFGEDPSQALADVVRQCRGTKTTVIAERVERVTDLRTLFDLGVDWAQGFSLAVPLEL